MLKRSSFRYFNSSPEIIRPAVLLHIRYPLSKCNVEDFLHERDRNQVETVRIWWNRFGSLFAAEIRRKLGGREADLGIPLIKCSDSAAAQMAVRWEYKFVSE